MRWTSGAARSPRSQPPKRVLDHMLPVGNTVGMTNTEAPATEQCTTCQFPGILVRPGQPTVCGDCRQDEQIAAGNGGHPDWARN